jgi:hypothetical protein
MTASAAVPRILIFDLSRHIHLPGYLHLLVEFWCHNVSAGELSIVTWHTFLRSHADVVRLAEQAPRRPLRHPDRRGVAKEDRSRVLRSWTCDPVPRVAPGWPAGRLCCLVRLGSFLPLCWRTPSHSRFHHPHRPLPSVTRCRRHVSGANLRHLLWPELPLWGF